ncbi:MAG: efflux RND transporter permease subunit [Planctomycetes bacterium]|nr:efflux RND transporter permease subunit [Planctomycetota bacterium]
MNSNPNPLARPEDGILGKVVAFCLQNRFVVLLAMLAIITWGIITAPFDWELGGLPRDPVAVDAIPDIGENQQIVFTEWKGRSPQDVEDQITLKLSSYLLGIPGVKSVRSFSMFGFSSIYVVFSEDVEFYWSRTRVLEKLNSLPVGTLPADVKPTLGPDATPLGQVFWYTLEGMDSDGNPTGGWGLEELRSIQDWIVRYELTSVTGVSEVASVGGFVKEYQVDVDPDAMWVHGVTLGMISNAVRSSNLDTGARTMEINNVEYVIRGIGFIKSVSDLEQAVVKETDNIPIRIKDVARVTLGPALRRGALDKGGAEVVGGVVVARYGANPLEVIKNIKEKIAEFAPTLKQKMVTIRMADGSTKEVLSKVSVVPFYDRSGLIKETLGTLDRALEEEILVTIIVVVVMLMHLRSSALISSLLPMAVLMCFIAMRYFGVDANIVALSGIAIAIGTMVDMGIVLNENILRQLDEAPEDEPTINVVYRATIEVGSAVMTAVLTTVISFLPVFTMQAAEGKLFKPLAFTKTFALLASLIVALTIIPPMALTFFRNRRSSRQASHMWTAVLMAGAFFCSFILGMWLLAGMLLVLATYNIYKHSLTEKARQAITRGSNYFAVLAVAYFLSKSWVPLGVEKGIAANLIFVCVIIGAILGFFHLFQYYYPRMLRWCLANKGKFLLMPVALCVFGLTIWLGFDSVFSFVPKVAGVVGLEDSIRQSSPWVWAKHEFPGLGKEFMPDLDEGSFLLMPTTMPHASIGETMDILSKQDMAINAIPEIDSAVGKIGRVDSSLDPAPISMIETVINYKPEYIVDQNGKRLSFRYQDNENDVFRDEDGNPVPAPDGEPYIVRGKFIRDDSGKLIGDSDGKPFRLWRPTLDPELNPGRKAWPGINDPAAIWSEIIQAAKIPGTTSAPKLQPIAARIVMLQSGMRAPMGVKVFGKGQATLDDLEKVGIEIEKILKQVPAIESDAVTAERIVGKPYCEIVIDRAAIQRYNVNIADVQNIIQTAIGGMPLTTTVEGREQYSVRVRYKRELRDTVEDIERILVPNKRGQQVPLKELIVGRKVQYRRGPQVIKSEDGGLVTYVLFDKRPGYAEVDTVKAADNLLKEKVSSGELVLPAGVSYKFAGSYENQIRSEKRLMLVLPLALFLIFLVLYFQFKRVSTTMLVFSGIAVAWAGGFIMIWLYGQGWFMDVTIYDINLRELFQVHPINLSVAIWVGFLALFGIATDDGVVMATYLDQAFDMNAPESVEGIRETTLEAGKRRIRPCLMTTATTILALLPVLTSTGRGADIMVPMAIPSFGGMVIELITLFVVPVLYCWIREVNACQREQHF